MPSNAEIPAGAMHKGAGDFFHAETRLTRRRGDAEINWKLIQPMHNKTNTPGPLRPLRINPLRLCVKFHSAFAPLR
jgi:hypothetical protein